MYSLWLTEVSCCKHLATINFYCKYTSSRLQQKMCYWSVSFVVISKVFVFFSYWFPEEVKKCWCCRSAIDRLHHIPIPHLWDLYLRFVTCWFVQEGHCASFSQCGQCAQSFFASLCAAESAVVTLQRFDRAMLHSVCWWGFPVFSYLSDKFLLFFLTLLKEEKGFKTDGDLALMPLEL